MLIESYLVHLEHIHEKIFFFFFAELKFCETLDFANVKLSFAKRTLHFAMLKVLFCNVES